MERNTPCLRRRLVRFTKEPLDRIEPGPRGRGEVEGPTRLLASHSRTPPRGAARHPRPVGRCAAHHPGRRHQAFRQPGTRRPHPHALASRNLLAQVLDALNMAQDGLRRLWFLGRSGACQNGMLIYDNVLAYMPHRNVRRSKRR